MEKIKKLPSGNYNTKVAVAMPDGTLIRRSVTGKTKSECMQKALDVERELRQLAYIEEDPTQMTVNQAITTYISDNEGRLGPKTVRSYLGYQKNNAKMIMDKKICDLNSAVIQASINKDATRLAPKSIRSVYGLVLASIYYVAPDCNYRVRYPQKEEKVVNIPSEEQIVQLIESFSGTRMEIPVMLAATLGLRRGEIAALDLNEDIDYERCLVHVTKAITKDKYGEWIVTHPKTKSSVRSVEAPAWVIEKLKQAADEGYEMVHAATISSNFKRRCQKLGIDIHFHDLRHYYASVMLKLGVPDLYAAERMGHATTNMLKSVYQHTMEDKAKEVAADVNTYLEKLKPGE